MEIGVCATEAMTVTNGITSTAAMLLTLASIMEGEAQSMGFLGKIAVGHVAWNRLADDMGPFGEGFYGRANPSPQSLWLAKNLGMFPDPTFGAKFVISEQDRINLKWRDGDVIFIGPAGLKLHCYWEWPEGEP